MASPLLVYENGRLLVPDEGTVTQVGGRWVTSQANAYLVKLFIKRSQGTGVSSGGKKLPLESQLNGEMLPGASGDSFFYRGYALEYAPVAADWDLTTSDETGLAWAQVTTQFPWLSAGRSCQFRFGQDQIMPSTKIQRSSGVFGGEGVDQIIYQEIGGVQIQLTGGEVQN
jgi:hypothetical protein